MPITTPQQRFLALSKAVTGHDDLDPALSASYLQRMQAVYTTEFDALLVAFGDLPGVDPVCEIKRELMQGPHAVSFTHLIKEIVNVWYTSQFEPKPPATGQPAPVDPPTDVEHYRKALMYVNIKAPVRGFSDKPYGYWSMKL